MKRIKIEETGNEFNIEIKAHNSLMHMFFTLLVLNAAAAFILVMTPAITVILPGPAAEIFGTIFFTAYIIYMFYMFFRSILSFLSICKDLLEVYQDSVCKCLHKAANCN